MYIHLLQTDVTDDELKYDWWSKYYASVGEDSKVQEGYVEESQDKLVVSICKLVFLVCLATSPPCQTSNYDLLAIATKVHV